MTTYYKLSEDKTHIEQSTPFKEVAEDLGLDLETEEEIVYGYDGKQYIKGTEPVKPNELVVEEIRQQREAYYKEHCDPLTCEKIKNTALGLWSEEDEQEYVSAMQKAKEEVEMLYPYPVE
jgi:hypothetical protein